MTPHSTSKPRSKWSSRGRLHNAIEAGNELAVRTMLAMGMDVEELDSNGRTPLIHATVNCQEATCKLLLGKSANVAALGAFTSGMGMDIKEKSELLDPLIKKALGDGPTLVTVVRLLVLMALGSNDGDDNGSSSQSMMNVAIVMSYGLVRAIMHLEL